MVPVRDRRGRRYARRDALSRRDPDIDYHEIYRQLATLEFPWDIYQALSFALFRTYAVPSIGELLHRSGEFTARVQKRYDDTVLILDAVLEHGFDHPTGRAAIRRMNQMHGSYPISNDDLRYVLAAFVVVPVRWLRDYGWRQLTDVELRASVAYYQRLGTLMGIHDIPADLAGFERLLDDYEAAHFHRNDSSRRIADVTLDLMATFPAQRTAAELVGPPRCPGADGSAADRRSGLPATESSAGRGRAPCPAGACGIRGAVAAAAPARLCQSTRRHPQLPAGV